MTVQEWKKNKREPWFVAWIYIVFVVAAVILACIGGR
jgi:hypothetical protein